MLEKEFKALKPEFDELIQKYVSGEKPLSYSSFKSFVQGGPRGFFENRMIKKQSESMADGVAFHAAVLEPEKFFDAYYVFDDSAKVNKLINSGSKNPRATKEYKEWKLKEMEKYEGKIELSKDKYDLFVSMKEYLYSNSLTSPIMESINEKEKTILFDYEGFKWVVKIDALADLMSIDLKKAANARPDKIKWVSRDMHYDIQAGITAIATGIMRHTLIFIENGHLVSVGEYTGDSLENAINKIELYLIHFKDCIEQDAWHESINFFAPKEIQRL